MSISPDITSGPYTANGSQTAFPFTFTALSGAEVAVTVDGVAVVSGFTVSLTAAPGNGGTVNFTVAPASGAVVALASDPDYLQDSQFGNQSAYNLSTVDAINRRNTVKAMVTDRKFNDLLPLVAIASDITTVAGIADDVAEVAGLSAGITALGAIAGNITTVAGISGNVTTVAGISANVTTVAGIAANVTTVAGIAANVTAVAGNATNINAVATDLALGSGSSFILRAPQAAIDAANSAAAAAASATTAAGGIGEKNVFPDPFFTSTSLTTGFTAAQSDTPYVFLGAWSPITVASAASPYPSGMMLNRPSANVTVPEMVIYLDNLGLTQGDVVQVVQEMFLASGSATSGDFCTARWRDRTGTVIGSAFSILTPSAGTPLNTTCKSWNSGSLTIPTGAAQIDLQWGLVTAIARSIVSFQIVKIVNGNTAPSKPIQRLPLPDVANRITVLEAQAPGSLRNGVIMRRSTYASATTAYPVGTIGAVINTFLNGAGSGQSFLAAACPTLGFNMITTPLNWTPNAATGAARIEVVVRTCATGSNPLTTGKTIAWGYIDTDPTSGTASGESIQLFDPITGAPKTVMPADLLDLMGIGLVSVNSQGATVGGNPQLFVTYASHSNADPALPGYQAPGAPTGLASTWSSIGGATQSFVPQLTLAVSPVTATKTPSATFGAAVGALVDEAPAIIALPKTVYAVIGREASIYYDAVQQRDAKRTNFTASWSGAVPSGSGGQEERIKYIPTAAATNTLTLKAYRGDLFSSSATCAIVSVAASAASGTRVIHCLGDSLIQNGGMLTALRNISLEAGSVTALTFIGSAGTAPLLNDGYSGQPLGAFRAATIGGGPNPFYNSAISDFDYAYWMSHTGSGFAAADFVFIEAGGVDVGAPVTDADAQAAAAVWAANAEVIAASIHAANATAKIVFYTKEAGPTPGQMPAPDPSSSFGPIWRIRRNWKILAAKAISQFGNRATDKIYVSPTASSIDPENGWGRTMQPRSAAVTYAQTTYATYAALAADLTKGAGTLAYATDVASWFVKVGGAGLGRWRDARIEDGFIMRHTDTVHYANGALQVAEANWAVIKALG